MLFSELTGFVSLIQITFAVSSWILIPDVLRYFEHISEHGATGAFCIFLQNQHCNNCAKTVWWLASERPPGFSWDSTAKTQVWTTTEATASHFREAYIKKKVRLAMKNKYKQCKPNVMAAQWHGSRVIFYGKLSAVIYAVYWSECFPIDSCCCLCWSAIGPYFQQYSPDNVLQLLSPDVTFQLCKSLGRLHWLHFRINSSWLWSYSSPG